MTPQLALRVAIVGGVALVMFAVIFFRLWFLQVLSGSQYVAQAQINVVRTSRWPPRVGRSSTARHAAGRSRCRCRRSRSPRTSLPAPVSLTAARTSIRSRRRTIRCTTSWRGLLRMRPSRTPCTSTSTGTAAGPVLAAAGADPMPDRPERLAGRIRERDDQDRRPTDIQDYIAERQNHSAASLPGDLPAQVPARRRWRAGVRHARPDQLGRAQHEAVQGHQAGQYRRPDRASSTSTTSTCRAPTARSASRSTPQGQFEGYAKYKARLPATTSSCRSTPSSSRSGSRRCRSRSPQTPRQTAARLSR